MKKKELGIPKTKNSIIVVLFMLITIHMQAFTKKLETKLSPVELLQTSSTVDADYEPIVDTNKMWVVFNHPTIEAPGVGFTGALKIKDSVLLDDGNYWFKVMESFDSTYSEWSLQGYIREFNKIVVYEDKQYDRIDTIYNFNKNIGDTLKLIHINLCIADTSTIAFANKNRFTQFVEVYSDTLLHIEGIGSTDGLIGPYWYGSTGLGRRLVCYYYKDEIQYMNPNFSNCYMNITSINSKNKNVDCKVYPNPVKTQLNIEFSYPFTGIVTVYSLDGKNISQNNISQKTSCRINTINLKRGIYILKLQNKNKQEVSYKKFIVEQ